MSLLCQMNSITRNHQNYSWNFKSISYRHQYKSNAYHSFGDRHFDLWFGCRLLGDTVVPGRLDGPENLKISYGFVQLIENSLLQIIKKIRHFSCIWLLPFHATTFGFIVAFPSYRPQYILGHWLLQQIVRRWLAIQLKSFAA